MDFDRGIYLVSISKNKLTPEMKITLYFVTMSAHKRLF